MTIYDPDKPWLARVVIPFWAIQLVLSGVFLAIASFVLKDAHHSDHEVPEAEADHGIPVNDTDHSAFLLVIILVVFSAISFFLVFAEMVAYSNRKLRPLVYLCSNCINVTLWAAYLIAVAVTSPLGRWTWQYMVAALFIVAFLGTLIYASVIYHRQRRSMAYVPEDPRPQRPTTLVIDTALPSPWLLPTLSQVQTQARPQTSYDLHAGRDELHLPVQSPLTMSPPHSPRSPLSPREPTLPNMFPTSSELDEEGRAALHPAYRSSIYMPIYEPLRHQDHEVHADGPSPASPTSHPSPHSAYGIGSTPI